MSVTADAILLKYYKLIICHVSINYSTMVMPGAAAHKPHHIYDSAKLYSNFDNRNSPSSLSLLIVLDLAPPRPSPSSLLLSSTKAGEVLGLTPSNWGHGAAEVPSVYLSSCPAFVSAAPMWVAVWGRYDRSAERRLR